MQALRNLQTWPGGNNPRGSGSLTSPITVALVLDYDEATPKWIDALAERGCRSLVWIDARAPTLAVLEATRVHGIRILGPGSAGVIDGASGRNLSTLPLTPRCGSLALIAQSQSIAAAAVDWAIGRGVGFSWIAVTGDEADVDVADLLDRAALDPETRSVILQVSRLGSARKFMSAARAVARIKPVLVLQTAAPRTEGDGAPDPARSAAFVRAGLVECESMSSLFEGLAALQLVPAVIGDRIAVVGNGTGVCALATTAILRQGLHPAPLEPLTRQRILERVSTAQIIRGAIDLGQATPLDVVAVIRDLLGDSAVSAVILVHSPMAGLPHEALAVALAEAGLGARLLTVWLGLQTSHAARQLSTDARVPTFASADEAARTLRFCMQYLATRERLRMTPPPDEMPCSRRVELGHFIRERSRAEPSRLADPESAKLLDAYGMCTKPLQAVALARFGFAAWIHAEVGVALRLTAEPAFPGHPPAFALPPIDRLLARHLIDGTGSASSALSAVAIDHLERVLMRLAQMSVEQPHLHRIELVLICSEEQTAIAPDGIIELAAQAVAERRRVALAPYPASLSQDLILSAGQCYRVRVVRPSDEPAVLQLLGRLAPEEVRLRYFAFIRYFSHDMAARVTQVDYDREFTLVACSERRAEEIAAMATLVAEPDGIEAEFALLVHHDHVCNGLGRNLLLRLIDIARDRGIRRLHGDVLAENAPMLGLSRACGFSIRTVADDPGCRRVELSLDTPH